MRGEDRTLWALDVLDSFRPRLWCDRQHTSDTYQCLLAYLDLALLTLDNEQALFEETNVESIFNRYRQMGVSEVVIKRGAQSCLVQHDGTLHEVCATTVHRVIPPPPVIATWRPGRAAAPHNTRLPKVTGWLGE